MLDRETELEVIRRAFAKQILAAVRVTDKRLQSAFSDVRREDFLGAGPWQVFRMLRFYVPTPDDDPVYLYTDDLIGIAPERHINNGQPSLHAALIAAMTLREGDHVVHIGAGVGYYTAIMSELVGKTGRVTAVEYEPDLAQRTARNLQKYENVTVIEGDGTTAEFADADVIYVNAGATSPPAVWLDRLKDGGRLLLPLTTGDSFTTASLTTDWGQLQRRGMIFKIQRQGTDYAAKWVAPVAIFPCVGGRDAAESEALASALDKGTAQKVTRLYRNQEIPDERCWLRGKDWCLAYS